MTDRTDFWSRRKALVEAEEAALRQDALRRSEAEARAELEEKTDAEILDELALPDPDTLGPGDDFSGFMAKAVPDRIRRRALRKLWLTNPTLANVDGLIDYGEDFTDAALVVENMQTAYQVGKGMLKHVEELARAAEAEAKAAEEAGKEDNGEEVADDAPQPEDDAPEEIDVMAEAPVATPMPAPALDDFEDDPETMSHAPTTRRMRFDYAS